MPASAEIEICVPGQQRSATETCIVDGDTLWLDGVMIRLYGFDTPEPISRVCGGRREIDLAHQASALLQQLMNTRPWSIVYFGMDRSGRRRLATIFVDGRDVGEILIEAGLARVLPDGNEFWCPTVPG